MMATVIEIEPSASLVAQTATFNARLRGVTPLLMHKPNLQANTGEVKRSGAKNIPTAEAEAEQGAYKFPDGVLYLPAVSLQRAMIEAAKGFQDPVRKRATLMKAVAATLSPPDVEGYPLLDPETGEPISQYEIDVRRAVIQRKDAIMRARPIIKNWVADVEMGFDLETVSPSGTNGGDPTALLKGAGEVLLMVLAQAGSKVGVLDYRPEKSGPFGRFTVEQFRVVKDD